MIDVSYLQHIYKHKETKDRILHRSQINSIGSYDSFPEFVDGFLASATPPRAPSSKHDAYGWCATLFEPSGKEDRANELAERWDNPRVLAHRAGEYAHPQLTIFFADLDNQHDDRPFVSLDQLEAIITSFGLSYLLYTSFSNKPSRNKVRIIIPVDRPMTPDEAFEVFKIFNYALNYQLDGSVYDPGDFLYGPLTTSETRVNVSGDPIDVNAYMALVTTLPEEAQTFVKREAASSLKMVATPTQIANAKAMFTSDHRNDNVSINNPRYFNPEWFQKADDLYCGGSHWQTAVGLMTKVWLKSQQSITRIDMESILAELDTYWAGYLSNAYSRSERDRIIKDAMSQVGTLRPIITTMPTDRELHAATSRLKRKKIKR